MALRGDRFEPGLALSSREQQLSPTASRLLLEPRSEVEGRMHMWRDGLVHTEGALLLQKASMGGGV